MGQEYFTPSGYEHMLHAKECALLHMHAPDSHDISHVARSLGVDKTASVSLFLTARTRSHRVRLRATTQFTSCKQSFKPERSG